MPENVIQGAEKKLESFISSEPWYVWAGAITAAGVIVYFVYKRRTAATIAPGKTADQMNGYTMADIAGLPYGELAGGYNYQSGPVDNYPGGWSSTAVGDTRVPIIPGGASPVYDPNGNLVGFQQPGPTSSPLTQPAPGQTGLIRPLRPGDSYDKNHPGVPVRGEPGTGGPDKF